jgi:TrmH family RNA methyltransferase
MSLGYEMSRSPGWFACTYEPAYFFPMIPIDKLKKRPRSQRLRKFAKIFGEAEYRLSLEEPLALSHIVYLNDALSLLPAETFASPAAAQTIAAFTADSQLEGENLTCPEGFHRYANGEKSRSSEFLRILNTARHILLAETGKQTADWDFIDHQGRLDPQQRRSFPGMLICLEDIRSPYNVGAMFRTAESFGVEKIYLSPLCADPLHSRASRTAMGCISILPWKRLPDSDLCAGIGALPDIKDGPFFALETGGTPLSAFQFPSRAVMLAGSEELGLSPGALELADRSLGRVTIPAFGAKGSLNVSVAFGIVVQAWAEALSAGSHAGCSAEPPENEVCTKFH